MKLSSRHLVTLVTNQTKTMAAIIRKLGPEALRFLDAVRRYQANPVTAAQRYWNLYRHRRFSPDEIHFQRLLDPALTETDLLRAVSKEELLGVQAMLNPQSLHTRTEDKIQFHSFCRANDLPVPDIYALYDQGAADAAGDIPRLGDVEGIKGFLASTDADSFILKPVAGVNGEGVMRLDRSGSDWRDTHGKVFGAQELHTVMNRSAYARWIFQEVVRGHPTLAALSNTSGLQTVRVVTIVDQAGAVRILAARLRLICGDVAHDNFEFGKTGNVIAILNPENGQIESAVGGSRDRYEIQPVTRHPGTGRELIGFQVPDWEAVRKLAIEAAGKFRPLRSIGWDVAVSPDAPCLIEGNVTWATLSGEARMGEIYRHLRELANLGLPR